VIVGPKFLNTSSNTLQADALKLVAKALQSSLAVEGELPENGLAAYGDDGWRAAATEPEVATVNGNGATGDGHHEAIGLGPSVEPVLGNGQHAAPLNGNGHHDEVPAPQSSLFSWAEFMAAQRARPKGRRCKAQARRCPCSSGCLERERQPVGAGGVGAWGAPEPKRQPGNPDAPPRSAVAWWMEALAWSVSSCTTSTQG